MGRPGQVNLISVASLPRPVRRVVERTTTLAAAPGGVAGAPARSACYGGVRIRDSRFSADDSKCDPGAVWGCEPEPANDVRRPVMPPDRVDVVQRVTIACPPREFLEFVMDIERYAEVDDKIGPILWTRRQGNVVTFGVSAEAGRTAPAQGRADDAAHAGRAHRHRPEPAPGQPARSPGGPV